VVATVTQRDMTWTTNDIVCLSSVCTTHFLSLFNLLLLAALSTLRRGTGSEDILPEYRSSEGPDSA
jgi:hypothetical protein